MNLDKIMPVLISFAISVVLCPVIIPLLKKLNFSQYVREEGPGTHKKKEGTPTMGGIIILISLILTSLLYMEEKSIVISVVYVTLAFGLIGFLDDYIKVVLKRSLGLFAWQKLVLELIVASVFLYYLMVKLQIGTLILIPFTNGFYFDLNWFYIPIMLFAMIGTVNGVNFTDGLDGLACGVTTLVASFFSVAAAAFGSPLLTVTCAATGGLLGFLTYNVYPARVFMGDTGSLAIGGFVAATAIMLRMPFFLFIVGFVYCMEVISVILQVMIFRITKGKRLFRMAPIHHHFELCGFPETVIVTGFSVITALLCILSFGAF